MKNPRKHPGINDSLQRISAMMNQGKLLEARGACIKACNKNRNSPDAWSMLGMIHGSMNEFSEAASSFEKAVRLDTGNATHYYNLGFALLNNEDHREAIDAFRKALGLNRNMTEARFYLAVALQATGDFQDAETLYQDVIRDSPTIPDTYIRLSMIFMATERLDKALKACQSAIDINSKYAGAYLQMGRVLGSLERHEEAVQHFLESVTIDSKLTEGYIGLGDSFFNLGRLEDAARYYRDADCANPDNPLILLKLGHTYQTIGRAIDAVICFEKALDITPDDPGLLYNYGDALETAGRQEDALSAYKKSNTLNPDSHNALAGVAHILEKQGCFDEALEVIKPVTQDVIHDFRVAMVYADLLSHVDHKTEAKECLEAYLSNNPDSKQDFVIHFRLGKLMDSINEYDAAFKQYTLANKKASYYYDASKQVDYVDKCIQGFSIDNFHKMPRSSVKGKQLVFIVGMPRSGTSLIEQILASHPMLIGAGELTDIEHITNELANILRKSTHEPFPSNIVEASTQIMDELSTRYYSRINDMSGNAACVTDKMPHNFRFLGLIELLFPESRIIHCNRNPLDTCLSIYFQSFSSAHGYASDLTALGKYYCEYRRLMEHWRNILSIPILDIYYEDTVSDKENTIRKIVEFCGLPWDEDCLDFHKSRRYVSTPSYDQVRQPMYTKSVERWKNYETHLDELVKALGEYAEL